MRLLCFIEEVDRKTVRERRRTLRYRKLLVRQNVQLRNEVSQMLMESGVVYNKQKLHKAGYFKELMETNLDICRELKHCWRSAVRPSCGLARPRVH
jgi:hypothetical protein